MVSGGFKLMSRRHNQETGVPMVLPLGRLDHAKIGHGYDCLRVDHSIMSRPLTFALDSDTTHLCVTYEEVENEMELTIHWVGR